MVGPVAARADDCAPAATAGAMRETVMLVKEYPGAPGGERNVLQSGDGRLWLREADLAEWRLRLPAPALERGGERWHALDAIAGLRYAYDACAQALDLDLNASPRATRRYETAAPAAPRPDPVPPGGFLNLDAQHVRVGETAQTAWLAEAGLFNDLGRGTQTFVVRDGQAQRLDSYWVREDEERLRTLRLGDAVSRPGAWGRAVRFGGVQWGTDFSLQPYLTTFPQPTLRGDAALPSTVDVFVNGNLRARQAAEPGPFELREVPALTGAGELLAVVRDPLGRESRIVQPFYVSPRLLRRGLAEVGLDAGWIRQDYGLESARYGDFVGTATLRQGVTDRFTRELRLEAQSDGATAGAEGLWLAGGRGLLSIQGAFGQGRDRRGLQFGLGFEREIAGGASFGFSGQWAEPGFLQIGAPTDEPALRQRSVLRLGLQPHAGASAALAAIHESRRGSADVTVMTAAYGLRVWRSGQLGVSATQAQSEARSRLLMLNLTWPLGTGASAAAQQERTEGGDERSRVTVQGNPLDEFGFGYRLGAERGADSARADLYGQWRAPRGTLSGEVVDDATRGSYRVGAATAVALLDGDLFWTRPVTGSFAVLRVDGVPGVDIYSDNRLAGRTDERGRALVPNLRPYEANRLSVLADDIPIETPLDALARIAVPRTRSGVRVDFSAGEAAALLFRPRFADGAALSPAALVRDRASGAELPVGMGGEVYLQGAPGRYRLDVRDGARQCALDVELGGGGAAAPIPEPLCEVRPS